MMSRMKLHCSRALPEWGPDGPGDANNTKLLRDVALFMFGGTTRQVQEARRQRDGNEPDFDSLPQGARDALDARRLHVLASMLDFQAGVTMVGR